MLRRKFLKLGASSALASVFAPFKSMALAATKIATIAPKIPSIQTNYPFSNPDLPMQSRLADLIGRLTTREKISLLYFIAPAIPRLGIQQYSLGNEGLHGLVRPGENTVFPQAIGLAATFNPSIVERMSAAISDEARARWNINAPDIHQSTCGPLLLWAPVVNMARDPRWGRTQETYGEDPHLTAKTGVAYVRGLQGGDPRYTKVVATLKHFAGYNVEANRFAFNAVASNRYWFEYEFVPYRACIIEGKAGSVMGAYNAINGVPCCCNRWLLTDVLRGRWNFEGFVVSDCGAISHICGAQKYVKTPSEAASAALNAGLDMECGQFGKYPEVFNDYLPKALDDNLVTMETMDRALSRVLKARFQLGMFDPPNRVPYSRISGSVIGSQQNIQLARQIAQESIVLMQNRLLHDGRPLLPICSSKIDAIAILGNSAGQAQLGDYSGKPSTRVVTLVSAIGERLAQTKHTNHSPEMRWIVPHSKSAAVVLSTEDTAYLKTADVVIVCLTSRHAEEEIDQDQLELSLDQEALIEHAIAINPRVIAVLFTGTAVAIPWMKEHVPAILNAWYPGEQGGNALTDVIFGDYNPAGRLPLTYYAATNELPPMDEYDLTKGNGRTYMYFKRSVLYPFGHGLSYTRFVYSNLRLSSKTFRCHDRLIPGSLSLTVWVDVTNVGDQDGDEVVQAFIHQVESSFPQPIQQLKAFSRVRIPQGKTETVELMMPLDDWALWDESRNCMRVFPGSFDVLVGASAGDIRLKSKLTINSE